MRLKGLKMQRVETASTRRTSEIFRLVLTSLGTRTALKMTDAGGMSSGKNQSELSDFVFRG
jgi:hypothetical protein